MKLLLDTHVLIWWVNGDPKLAPYIRQSIQVRPAVISVAVFWELGIKIAQGRVELAEDLGSAADRAGFETLNIDRDDARLAAALPPIHGDPFDRMLVAQANRHGLVLATQDRRVQQYGVAVLRP